MKCITEAASRFIDLNNSDATQRQTARSIIGVLLLRTPHVTQPERTQIMMHFATSNPDQRIIMKEHTTSKPDNPLTPPMQPYPFPSSSSTHTTTTMRRHQPFNAASDSNRM
eukprot:539593-Rhodomonas_salina.1